MQVDEITVLVDIFAILLKFMDPLATVSVAVMSQILRLK